MKRVIEQHHPALTGKTTLRPGAVRRACLSVIVTVLALTMAVIQAAAQTITLDQFETTEGWSLIKSDGAEVSLSIEEGLSGNAIRFDYHFTLGTGYGGLQKPFPMELPDNYEFSFSIRAESPANNFEVKFIDSTGNNVWWVNNRNWDFPSEWTRIRIKKRDIGIAWGPDDSDQLHRFDRIEFTIASFEGGKGTIWLDSLQFRPLPPERESWPQPSATATSYRKGHNPSMAVDGQTVTGWRSRKVKGATLLIDLMTEREFGGVEIRWQPGREARHYELMLSQEGVTWEKAAAVSANSDEVSFIRLPGAEARYLKLNILPEESRREYGISEIRFPDIKSSQTLNDFLIYAAHNSPPGNYPAYFSEKASYWTITGVNSDVKEALISESGMVEPEKGAFSLEPMIRIGDSLYNHSNVIPEQSMGFPGLNSGFIFLPSVTWHFSNIEFVTGVSSHGEANTSSCLYTGYSFRNLSESPAELAFFVMLRPFQVNPYYQFLNTVGGAGKIQSLSEESDGTIRVDGKPVFSSIPYHSFRAMAWEEGNPVNMIRRGDLPKQNGDYNHNTVKSAAAHHNRVTSAGSGTKQAAPARSGTEQAVSAGSGTTRGASAGSGTTRGLSAVTDPNRLASGIIEYQITLEPGERKEFFIAVPFHGENPSVSTPESFRKAFIAGAEFWNDKVNHIGLDLPVTAERLIDTWKSNLIYILINRDNAGIQPGSRSYDRSWIRDGALTSSALLKSGITEEVREFIEWYTSYQYENGKVPCVVDFRGPDPVPENDSHGEMIYLIREYFNFTGDTALLRTKNDNVLRAVYYIRELISQRSTDYYKYGNDSVRAHYGLVPESISHEGYSAKPMHSYWDNFFTMKGLKDAADIEHILGNQEAWQRVAAIRDTFRVNLYNSLQLAMKVREIDYIPGCVELGDFDPTSTTIALTPCNELTNLPEPQIYNTFSHYYDFFTSRRDGTLEWVNYTPYENRVAGSFIMLDQPERAHQLFDYFLADQRPGGWNHWAEVVWRDMRRPAFIGDMPHTWCGSDFINAIRTAFVYENEYDQTLAVGAALRQEWIDAPDGMAVRNLPTYYGEISYSINRREGGYLFQIGGDLRMPANGIIIKNFNGGREPLKVVINGTESVDYDKHNIAVQVIPATVEIFY